MTTLTAEELLAGASLTHRVAIPGQFRGSSPEAGEVVLRPLLLADVLRLNRAAGDDTELAGALMLQQALVEPSMTLDQVHRLPAGAAEFLLGEVNRVSGLSMSPDELSEAVHAPLARACLVLGREFGWSPDRCAELTVGQVLLYLEMLARGDQL